MLSADTVEVTTFGARGYIKVSAATAEVTPQILNPLLAKNRKMSVSQCS